MEALTKKYCDEIYNFRTLPPQIDYINPKMASDVAFAQRYIDNLPEDEQKEALEYIEEQIIAYYTDDKNGYSPAYYASLF